MPRNVWLLLDEGVLEAITEYACGDGGTRTDLRWSLTSEGEWNEMEIRSFVRNLRPNVSPQMMRKDGKPPKLRPKEMDQKKLMKTDLIYLTESPDYCERNDE